MKLIEIKIFINIYNINLKKRKILKGKKKWNQKLKY